MLEASQGRVVGSSGLGCTLGLAYRPDNGAMYTVEWNNGSDMSLYTINVTTAATTLVGKMFGGFQIEGLAIPLESGEFGDGCPGTGGIVPRLLTTDATPADGSAVSFFITKGLGGAQSVLVFGAGKGQVFMGGGCALYAVPLLPLSVMIPLGGSGPGKGEATLAGTLPTGASGFNFTMQVFTVDPGSVVGFANSNGLEIQIQ